jgi:hypothetical protein
MQLKWVVFMLTLWIVVAFMVGIAEGAMIGGMVDADGQPITMSMIERLTDGSVGEKVGAFLGMMRFNFSIFDGDWAILQWIFFLPFAVAFGIFAAAYTWRAVLGRG